MLRPDDDPRFATTLARGLSVLRAFRIGDDGLSNAEIAQRLSLSELSVKKYVSRIFDAAGLRNRAELATAVLRSRRRAR